MSAVTHDRGLGSAYERYCFYQRLDVWADEYGVTSMLEGPLDGMAGIAGVHGVGLARRGMDVVAAVDRPEKVELARGVYARAGAKADVRVVAPLDVASLPMSDMVVSYHALPQVEDWRSYVRALASRARKVLIVSICNPENWGFSAVRWFGRLRGIRDFEPPDVWHKEVLAPALWDLGRVRDHVFFDCPWWPDMPVAAGQSVADRAKKLLQELGAKRRLQRAGSLDGVKLSDKFVYGVDKWPYFGGQGWADELLPALLRHPTFDGSKTRFLPRLAHLHAFVVDMRARTPQARRRLGQVL